MPANKFFPYKPVPPENFVGRTSELYTIFDQINKRGHIAISGRSCMGKSSLLKYIESQNSWNEKNLDFSTALIVYKDCGDLSTPHIFWQEVLKDLKNKTHGNADLQDKIEDLLKPEKSKIEVRDIRQILRKIGEIGKFLLLLLDNYNDIIRTPEEYSADSEKSREMLTFLSGLRNLAIQGEEGKYFSTVVATFQQLDELGPKIGGGSPWYNHYIYVDLKLFSQEDIENYFFNQKYFFISIPENIQKEKVLEITGGYPTLLQQVGEAFYTKQDIDINTLKTTLNAQNKHIFKDIWINLTEDEKKLLLLIVIDNSTGEINGKSYLVDDIKGVFERNNNKLTTLQNKGIIYNQKEQGKYKFSSSLMQDLVIQEFGEEILDPKKREILFEKFGIKITAEVLDKAKKIPLLSFIKLVKSIFKFG